MVVWLRLLFAISLMMGLTVPRFTVMHQALAERDLILIESGLFLLKKATREIHESVEGIEEQNPSVTTTNLGLTMFQIALLDIVFSLDSAITVVGLVNDISVMATASVAWR